MELGNTIRSKKAILPVVAALVVGGSIEKSQAQARPLAKRNPVVNGFVSSTNKVGYNVSYPNKNALPQPESFAIVGLNGGNAVKFNPYFKSQIEWAKKSKGSSDQPKAAIYVHTDNPGLYRPKVADWPKSGKNVDGTCNGSNSLACEYQYGENTADNDIAHEGKAGVKSVWLDVEGTEDGYTWEKSTSGNATVLEGMTHGFEAHGYKVGIYSGEGDWNNTIGKTPKGSDLVGLPDWILGAKSTPSAEANCRAKGFTGKVVIAQIAGSTLDRDIVC